ncbi:hypothetical protein SAMN04488692_108111 [Halarsenatibacter silvermanii]|uniref:Uncharacterized protein n=2 Tax=Halarsenatibacter silvermanii TaxID=321763 RepID=A0A1G9MN52_9FIRM|nr:hypothetical protein SAMN04488692_108111 [Halarsenatibacter silvermanii]
MMNRKIALLAALSILLSLIPLAQRYQLESSHRDVEVMIDGGEVQEIIEFDDEISWDSLQEAGATAAVHPVYSLGNLMELGKISYRSAASLPDQEKSIQESFAASAGETADRGAVFYFPEEIENLINPQVLSAWKDLYGVQTFAWQGGRAVHFPVWNEDLEYLVPGYESRLYDELGETDMRLTARHRYQPDSELDYLLLQEISELDFENIVFSGERVVGYPQETDRTAEALIEGGLNYKFIEPFLAGRDGARQLAAAMPENVIRTHIMDRDEMKQTPIDTTVDRYLRSVRERNVRSLYIRGIPPSAGFAGRGGEQELLTETITSDLQSADFVPGFAEPLSGEGFPSFHLLLTKLTLVITAGFVLISGWLPPERDYLRGKIFGLIPAVCILTAALAAGFISWLLPGLLLRQFTAFLAALIFPSLAGLLLVDIVRGNIGFISGLLPALAITKSGGLLIASVLAGTGFYNQIHLFRGVKISFLMPLVIIFLYFYTGSSSRKAKTEILQELFGRAKKFILTPITWGHILLGGLTAVVLLVYIGRTGNLPYVPVPAWELAIRDALESFLGLRPRFKEFLIGHPFLFLLPFLAAGKAPDYFKLPAVLLAAIGQITIVNSFSHLHTPLMVTIQRTAFGYLLSLPLALLLLVAYFAYTKSRANLSQWMSVDHD